MERTSSNRVVREGGVNSNNSKVVVSRVCSGLVISNLIRVKVYLNNTVVNSEISKVVVSRFCDGLQEVKLLGVL